LQKERIIELNLKCDDLDYKIQYYFEKVEKLEKELKEFVIYFVISLFSNIKEQLKTLKQIRRFQN